MWREENQRLPEEKFLEQGQELNPHIHCSEVRRASPLTLHHPCELNAENYVNCQGKRGDTRLRMNGTFVRTTGHLENKNKTLH